jgi:hypothetical protein
VYTYDAIGSYERTGYSCQGSGKDLMQPVLDNQLKAASPLVLPARVGGAWCGGCPCVSVRVRRGCRWRGTIAPSSSAPPRVPHPTPSSASPHTHTQNSLTELPLEQAVDLVKDAFVSAGERDIYTVGAGGGGGLADGDRATSCWTGAASPQPHHIHTPSTHRPITPSTHHPHHQGDTVEILIITKDGIKREELELKAD